MRRPSSRVLPIVLLAVATLARAPASPARAGDAPERAKPDPVALARDLAAAVDLPTPKARAAAADALAARAGVTLDDWLAVARAFAPSGEAPAPGATNPTVRLEVLDATESTSVAVVVPASLPKTGPAGLLLAFHGQGGTGTEMSSAWTAAAEASGLLVVAPTDAGKNDGYGFSPRERAAGLAALRWARRRFDVDENRIFVTGWSGGGHMAWDVALRHPDRFAAVIPVVGSPRLASQRAENNLRYLENLVDVSIRDLQGSKDDPRVLWNLRLAFDRLKGWKARDAQLVEFPDRAHDADLGAVDWGKYFAATRRDPRPARVVRRAAVLGEGRASWAEVLATDSSVSELVAPRQPAGWERMDDTAKRTFVEAEVEKKTARLEVVHAGPDRFEAKSTGVLRWRLLLDAESVDVGKPVTIVWNGKSATKAASASKSVLLHDFVERFDRTYLPVVDLTLP